MESEIEDAGGSVSVHGCDIRVEDDVTALIDDVLGRHGRIDALVNAGDQYPKPLADISSKGFEAVVRLNLFGGAMMMREVYNRWMADRGGAIVNVIADIWHGRPNFAHSGAARGGMLTHRERRLRMGPGRRPGQLRGPRRHREQGLRHLPAGGPARRPGLPEDDPVAGLRQCCRGVRRHRLPALPAAADVTGSCLRVDGGAPNARYCWNPPAPRQVRTLRGPPPAGAAPAPPGVRAVGEPLNPGEQRFARVTARSRLD